MGLVSEQYLVELKAGGVLEPVLLLLLGWVLGPGHGEHGAARLILGHQVALEVVSSMMPKT